MENWPRALAIALKLPIDHRHLGGRHNCDVLIHEVYTQASFDKISPEWKQYRLAYHTSSKELAEIANKAKPGMVILYHRANPGGDQARTTDCRLAGGEEQLLKEIRQAYEGKVVVISSGPITGRIVIDAKGLVVAPGFIDLHQHGQDATNYSAEAADGVTTALKLEVGVADIDRCYAERDGKALINYGASIGHIPVRMTVMHDPETFLPTGDAGKRVATDGDAGGTDCRAKEPLVAVNGLLIKSRVSI